MKKCFLLILPAFFSVLTARADIPSAVQCVNEAGDSLKWDFTVMALPANGNPGSIHGAPQTVKIVRGDIKLDLAPLFQQEDSVSYQLSAGSVEVQFQAASLRLLGSIGGAFGSVEPRDEGKLFKGPGLLRIHNSNGTDTLVTYACNLQLI